MEQALLNIGFGCSIVADHVIGINAYRDNNAHRYLVLSCSVHGSGGRH